MKNQFFRKLEIGEVLNEYDLCVDGGTQRMVPLAVSLVGMKHDGSFTILRPVPFTQVAGEESAYPVTEGENPGLLYATQQGMTKRERFAMAAMQGFIASPSLETNDCKLIAIGALKLADALIAALNAKEAE
jgi:hypothetical protein